MYLCAYVCISENYTTHVVVADIAILFVVPADCNVKKFKSNP